MQTGRQDNEYKPQSKDHRFESSTKKPPNRIQMYVMINSASRNSKSHKNRLWKVGPLKN